MMTVEIDPQRELIETALAILRHDRENPEIGMGMGYHTAVNLSLKQCVHKYGKKFEEHIDKEKAVEYICNINADQRNRGWYSTLPYG